MCNLNSVKYTELCAEMRRYRDYQLTASTWYSSILLAIIGVLLSLKYGDGRTYFLHDFNITIRILVLVLVTFIFIYGVYIVLYTHAKFVKVKEEVKTALSWPDLSICYKLYPHWLIIAIFILLWISSIIVIFT